MRSPRGFLHKSNVALISFVKQQAQLYLNLELINSTTRNHGLAEPSGTPQTHSQLET